MTVNEKNQGAGVVDARLADEQLLASIGYKQEFRRAFSPFQVFGVAFSIIGLLPSIASVLYYSVENGGPVSMVWGWAIMSCGVLTVGLAMAELGSACPTSGGLYYWTHSLSSPKWRNLLSWIVGYANTIASISAVASIDWGCAVQVAAAANIGSNGTFNATNGQLYGIYVAIVLSHGVICGLGTAVLAKLQTVYIALNVLLCLAVIIALPAATPTEYMNTAKFALGDFTNWNGWPNGYAFFIAGLAPLWTICGFDSVVHISEEAANAAVAIPWAIISAISIAGILGWAINVALAFCMGTDLESLAASSSPMADIFFQSFGQKGTLGIWAVVVIVQYMMGSSMLLSASRQTFAFARDGALPFSKLLYRMNSYTGTPVNTVWFVAFFALLFDLLVFAGPGAINAVFTTSVIAAYVAFGMPICARFLGQNDFKPGPFSLGRAGLPIGVIAVSFMSFMGVVFLFPMTPKTTVPEMNYSVVVLAGTLILSLVWFYFPKYGGVYWFTGPVRNVDVVSPETSSVAGTAAGNESNGKSTPTKGEFVE